jgi:hypothetical protein
MKIALAGDTMLGRMVGDRLLSEPWKPLFSDGVVEVLGRGGTVVDTRPVFIVIPAVGAGIGIPG